MQIGILGLTDQLSRLTCFLTQQVLDMSMFKGSLDVKNLIPQLKKMNNITTSMREVLINPSIADSSYVEGMNMRYQSVRKVWNIHDSCSKSNNQEWMDAINKTICTLRECAKQSIREQIQPVYVQIGANSSLRQFKISIEQFERMKMEKQELLGMVMLKQNKIQQLQKSNLQLSEQIKEFYLRKQIDKDAALNELWIELKRSQSMGANKFICSGLDTTRESYIPYEIVARPARSAKKQKQKSPRQNKFPSLFSIELIDDDMLNASRSSDLLRMRNEQNVQNQPSSFQNVSTDQKTKLLKKLQQLTNNYYQKQKLTDKSKSIRDFPNTSMTRNKKPVFKRKRE